MAFRDDLDTDMVENHLNPDEFGETVGFQRGTDPVVPIPAAYDELPITVENGTESPSVAYQPRVICRAVDLPAGGPRRGDKIILAANQWHRAGTLQVVDMSTESLGQVELLLQWKARP